jgi:hypothetical protein
VSAAAPGRRPPRLAAAALLLVAAAAHAQKPSEDPREDNPFVLAYRCEGGDAVAVRYPAFKDVNTQPITLSWDGKRYTLFYVRTPDEARYVTRNGQIEWRVRGHTGFLGVPGVAPPILAKCDPY